MAKGFYDFLFEFSSALGADEVSRIVDRFRRRGAAGGTTPTQPTARSAAQTGDVDDAYYDLKKANAPAAKQQTVWAWVQNLKQTQEGRAAIRRLERDKNTARIKNMFEQGAEDEWNASIPRSWRQQAEAFLLTLDPSTQEQIRKTFDGAVRRKEGRAATRQKMRERRWWLLLLYVSVIVAVSIALFPDLMLFGRTLVNLCKNLFK